MSDSYTHCIYYEDHIRVGEWFELYFMGIDPLKISRAKVVLIDGGRN